MEKSERIESLVDRLQLVISASRSDDGSDPESAPFRGLTPPENHRRHTDQAVLDEHLERFREVFDEAAIGMATITLAGRVVRANRALATLMARDAPDDGRHVLRRAHQRQWRARDRGPARHPRASARRHPARAWRARIPGPPARALDPGSGARLAGSTAVRVPPGAGRHPGAGRSRGAPAERGTVPAAGRDGAGLRDLHARPAGSHRQLERRRPTQQGLHGRRDHRTALPRLLPAPSAGDPPPRARAGAGAARRPLRGGGVAGPQGRLAVLGARRDHRCLQPCRRAHRLRQGHPGQQRAPSFSSRTARRPPWRWPTRTSSLRR